MAHHHPDLRLRRRDNPSEGRGELWHGRATVSRLFADTATHDGAEHEHVWIANLLAIDHSPDYAGNMFVAIRVTEGGIGAVIPVEAETKSSCRACSFPPLKRCPARTTKGCRCCTSRTRRSGSWSIWAFATRSPLRATPQLL